MAMSVRKGNPRMVIDGYVQELPADPGSAAAAVACDPMTDNAYSGQFFNVQVEQISRRLMFIALDGLCRLE